MGNILNVIFFQRHETNDNTLYSMSDLELNNKLQTNSKFEFKKLGMQDMRHNKQYCACLPNIKVSIYLLDIVDSVLWFSQQEKKFLLSSASKLEEVGL